MVAGGEKDRYFCEAGENGVHSRSCRGGDLFFFCSGWYWFYAADDCGSEWWVSFVEEAEAGSSFSSGAFGSVDLSPFALGDGLSDSGNDEWGSSDERWQEERPWLERLEWEGKGTYACIVYDDNQTLSGGEWSQSWGSENHNGLFDGEAFSSGNVRY